MSKTIQPTWQNRISLEDFPECFRHLAEQIGAKNALIVMREYEGEKIYFPKLGTAFKHLRDVAICNEWKELRNPGILGRKYGLTENAIRAIVGEHEDQQSLFA